MWNKTQEDSASNKVKGKGRRRPDPRQDRPGRLHPRYSYGISSFAKNKGTAMKWINWMLRPENQKTQLQKARVHLCSSRSTPIRN